MGFRFRRRIRIAPGFKVNLSKTSLSTSLGGRGFTLNIGRGKTRTTVGLPGTWISYSETASTAKIGRLTSALIWLLVFGFIALLVVAWA